MLFREKRRKQKEMVAENLFAKPFPLPPQYEKLILQKIMSFNNLKKGNCLLFHFYIIIELCKNGIAELFNLFLLKIYKYGKNIDVRQPKRRGRKNASFNNDRYRHEPKTFRFKNVRD